MSRLGWAGLYLAVVALGAHLGPAGVSTTRVAIAAGLALWGVAALRESDSRLVRALAIAAGAVIVLRFADGRAGLAALALLVACVAAPARRASAGFLAAVLGWSLLTSGIPWVGRFEVELSRGVSHAAGLLTGRRLDLGPSASGLHLLTVWILATLAATSGRRTFVLRRILAGAGAWFAYSAALPWIVDLLQAQALAPRGLLNMANVHPEPGTAGSAGVMFACLPIPCLLYMLLAPSSLSGETGETGEMGRAAGPLRPRAPAVIPAGAAVVLACLMVVTALPGSSRSGDVMILRTPTIDFSRPTKDRQGLRNAGMFGMLEPYLRMAGHRLRVVDRPVRPELLERASVLAVVLPVTPPEERERAALVPFLRRGGTLLVLGDHTDLLGTRSALNGWTGRWGVRFRFDSAYPVRRQWAGCIERADGGDPRWTGIGTGASLAISGGAAPLVVGRYALSDRGDRSNGGAGAFLGNYIYDEGERVGDLVLAASAREGRGRVVVFGDTSSLQNLMLPWSYPFVAALVDDLARTPRWGRDLGLALAGLLGALLGLMGLRGDARAAAALPSALLVALACTFASGGPERPEPPVSRFPVAHVDASHMNEFALELWRRDSIGGLLVNLQRDGFLPIVRFRGFGSSPPGPADLPVLVAPRVALGRREAENLRRHVEAGGSLLLAAGAAHGPAAAPLLESFGLRVGNVPLGPVPVEPDMTRDELERAMRSPQFRDAWPVIALAQGAARSLFEASGYTVVAESSGKAGRLVVLGDPDFLTDSVLEDEQSSWPGNVDYLERLLRGEGG